jgi:hypothetical protein
VGGYQGGDRPIFVSLNEEWTTKSLIHTVLYSHRCHCQAEDIFLSFSKLDNQFFRTSIVIVEKLRRVTLSLSTSFLPSREGSHCHYLSEDQLCYCPAKKSLYNCKGSEPIVVSDFIEKYIVTVNPAILYTVGPGSQLTGRGCNSSLSR